MKTKPFIYLLASIFIIIIIILIFIFYYLREIKSPQYVNIDPIKRLKLNSSINNIKDIFDSYELIVSDGIHKTNGYKNPSGIKEWIRKKYYEKDKKDYSYIDVDLELFYKVKDARESYDWESKGMWYKPNLADFIFGGNGDDRYCVSYVKEARADPEGLYLPMGYYYSFVIFQKNNLLIIIKEQTSHKDSRRKDNIINILAELLSSWDKYAWK